MRSLLSRYMKKKCIDDEYLEKEKDFSLSIVFLDISRILQ